MKQNVTRVKPIQRFEAQLPNELWQCDIMGKIDFPKIGILYGKHYYVLPGYIGCHICIKVIGNKVIFKANGDVFWKTRLKV